MSSTISYDNNGEIANASLVDDDYAPMPPPEPAVVTRYRQARQTLLDRKKELESELRYIRAELGENLPQAAVRGQRAPRIAGEPLTRVERKQRIARKPKPKREPLAPKLIAWLAANPGQHTVTEMSLGLDVSVASLQAALTHLSLEAQPSIELFGSGRSKLVGLRKRPVPEGDYPA
jgi:hypothetical protein